MPRCATIEPLDWHRFGDPSTLAQRFYKQADFIWLDSASPSHNNSQFHILAWQPSVKVVAQQGHVELHDARSFVPSLPSELSQLPFEALRWLAQQLSWPATNHLLPFVGGWLGYWGYDLGRYIERLPSIAEADINFADMSVGWYDAAVVIDQSTKQAWLVGEKAAVAGLKKQLFESPPLSQLSFQLTSDWRSNMNANSYANKFSAVQDYLCAGDCYQVNLAQRYQARFSGEPFAAYLALRSVNSGPFSAYINSPQGQVLSLSPERFIECRGDRIETKPIKGTRPRGSTQQDDEQQAADLLQADKDRAENLMIVDLLRNDLSKVATPSSVQVPLLFGIESFPSVHHLVSTVQAQLAEQYDVYDLLKGAFPGGSITGAPKIRAMEVIDELEPHRRSIYCGSIGYISVNGQMDTSITIRTLLSDLNHNIFCWAGGGLVADSECNAEYQETHDKVSRILPTLNQLK
ncbi:aminodeoxychorismate synthase component I [Neiella marina]|uniref:aminodeoxychorismate synthase n=1 Tax=Neiella holothuriorum TaxID=2870530 RepID=A0ABS7EJB3_9GAMM|nr:aminodeoxychorismate synthase component I [Neiella holothuriorum]MBW8192415.1 aminodeoxychorismate synthase component I [Neiella holothuriorum]